MNLALRSLAGFLALAAFPIGAAQDESHYWAKWRGPQMNGVAPHGRPPLRWSESRNVAWKVEIPGLGSSTPIIWDRTVFVQTAIPFGGPQESGQALKDWQREGRPVFEGSSYVKSQRKQRFVLMALDRQSGRVLWQRTLRETLPNEGIHPTNTWASASPVTDGERVFVFFGSHGLYALDLKGRVLWERDLGRMETRNGWGEGSSPMLHGQHLVVVWDHEGDSFIAAFDTTTGRELWRKSRDERSSWFTPLVVVQGGKPQIVTTGANHVRGYDLLSGDVVWTGPGLTLNAIPTPVPDEGRVYLTSGFRGTALLSVELDRASGDIEEAGAISWRYGRDTPYVSTPLLYRDRLYFVKHLKNVLTVLDTGSGQPVYGPTRLPQIRQVYASPVAAAGKVFLVGRDGKTLVLGPGSQLEILAENELDDGFDASPAIVGGELYLRGRRHLYRISE